MPFIDQRREAYLLRSVRGGNLAKKDIAESAMIFTLSEKRDGDIKVRILRDYWAKNSGFRIRKGETAYLPHDEALAIIASGAAEQV